MRRKLFLMSQVLGEPQDQQQMPLATAQAPAGHGEGSHFWLTGWPAACEPPLQSMSNHTWEAQAEHIMKGKKQAVGQLPNGSHASTIIMTKALLQDLHCMQALLQDLPQFTLQCHSS